MNMDTTVKPPHPGRFRILIQPWIVKIYRVAGMIALGAILVGLVAFLAVNLFYFFNRTWVRPVILSPEHSKVVAATTALAEARGRQQQMAAERIDAKAEQTRLDREIAVAEKFEADETPVITAAGKSVEGAMLRREVEKASLERLAAVDRKVALELRLKEIDGRAAEQDRLVARLAASPYIRATEERRVVGFVPYQNLSNVQVGVPLYGCDWGLIKCHKVGQVMSILDGEVQDVHPHDDSVQRGVMVEINLTDSDAAEQNVLFAGSKPFWWL